MTRHTANTLPPKLRAQLLNQGFAKLCERAGLPAPVAELRFHAGRRWRFDYAWPAHLVALEIEGGAWINGRHTRGAGFIADMEKYNAAAILGWRVLRVTPAQTRNGEALALLKEILNQPNA